MKKERFIPTRRLVSRTPATLAYAEGKSVLNIGMGGYLESASDTEKYFGGMVEKSFHANIARVSSSIVGIDLNRAALEIMRRHVHGEYFCGDITDGAMVGQLGRRFDCIILGEVLEHLDCCRAALSNIRNLLRKEGIVIITVPNAFSLESIAKMFFGYETCHEEHTCYFSYLTIKRLLEMNHMEMSDFCFTIRKRVVFDSVFSMISYATMRVITKAFPQFAQGLFVVARLA